MWITETISKRSEESFEILLGANMVATTIFSTSMQFMWGLVNTLQLIALTIFFDTLSPVNVQSVLINILKISNFDLYPTDQIYEKVFDFTETQPFNSLFEETGFESSNFILLTGTLFIFVLFYIASQILWNILIMSKKVKKYVNSKYFRFLPRKK